MGRRDPIKVLFRALSVPPGPPPVCLWAWAGTWGARVSRRVEMKALRQEQAQLLHREQRAPQAPSATAATGAALRKAPSSQGSVPTAGLHLRSSVLIRQWLPMTSSQAQAEPEVLCEPGGPLPRRQQQHTFLSVHSWQPPALSHPVPATQCTPAPPSSLSTGTPFLGRGFPQREMTSVSVPAGISAFM